MSRRAPCLVAALLWASSAIADDAQAPVKPGIVEPGGANPVARQSLDQLSATRERPLFSPGRRPPAPPPAHVQLEPAPPRAPPVAPNLTLVGVVLDTDEARAVVRSGTAVIRARFGDDIEGWKVTEIGARRLTLSHGDRSVAFMLFSGAHPGAPPSAIAMTDDRGPRGVRPSRPDAKVRRPPG
jgi:general secretion pathway protein N